MGQVLHGSATMTETFHGHTPLPLEDCRYALQATIPRPTRSSLHRYLHRHSMGRMSKAASRQRKRSKPVRSASSPSASPNCKVRKASFTFSSPSTGPSSSSSCNGSGRLPGSSLRPFFHSPRRRGVVQDLQCSDRQQNPAALPTALCSRADRDLHCPHGRHAVWRKRHRVPFHQDQPTFDKWSARKDEPDHQRDDGPAFPPRQPPAAQSTSRRLRSRLHLSPPHQDPRRLYMLRVHLQVEGLTIRTNHPRPALPEGETKHPMSQLFIWVRASSRERRGPGRLR